MRPDYAQQYERLYRHHWWWRAREAIVLRELRRLPLPASGHVLDVGCGNGLFLDPLAEWGEVYGIEVDESLLDDASPHRPRIHTRPLGDPCYAAWDERFDLATALDVIEHVQDDDAFLADMTRMLKPGGHLMLTAPAFDCLWDRHDEINHHYRRYRARRLEALCARHGEVVRLRHLFPSLFAPKWVIAHLNRCRQTPVPMTWFSSPAMSAILTRWLKAEARLTRPLRLPFGSSVLAVLRKPTKA